MVFEEKELNKMGKVGEIINALESEGLAIGNTIFVAE